MGNDDFRSNWLIFKKHEHKAGFRLIDEKIIKLYSDFRIAGYPFVPLTPFKYKDWEKLDLSDEDEREKRTEFTTEGKKSSGNRFVKVKFSLKDRKDTIEKDLRKLFKSSDPRKVVLISHSLPHNTNLDMLFNKEHVGSAALRKIIKENNHI